MVSAGAIQYRHVICTHAAPSMQRSVHRACMVHARCTMIHERCMHFASLRMQHTCNMHDDMQHASCIMQVACVHHKMSDICALHIAQCVVNGGERKDVAQDLGFWSNSS